jgi:hypothetical protein
MASTWQLRVSAYRKLRLLPEWIYSALQARGFAVRIEPGLGGMIRVIATLRSSGTAQERAVP